MGRFYVLFVNTGFYEKYINNPMYVTLTSNSQELKVTPQVT